MVRLVGLFFLLVSLSAFAQPSFAPLSQLPPGLAPQSTPERVTVFSDSIAFPEPGFEPVGEGRLQIHVDGARRLGMETLPEVPFYEKTYFVGDAELWVEGVEAAQSLGPVALANLPETAFWDRSLELKPPGEGRYFPGKFVYALREGNQLRVQYFPVQVDRQTGELIAARRIFVRGIQPVTKSKTPEEFRGDNEGLIITTSALFEGAKLLRDFQAKRYGVASDIVSIDAVRKKYPEVDETDLPNGYKDGTSNDDHVEPFNASKLTGYNYSLARKLVTYLRGQLSSGSKLKYVTLLGSAQEIPPSYYFSVRGGTSARFVVTDQCYVAVDKCQLPKAAVGRLPFTSLEEVRGYLAKVDSWLRKSSSSAHELSLYGGKAFGGPFYVGELSALRALPEKADWRGVEKYFRTKKNFDRTQLLDLVQGKLPSSVVFHMDHGKGNKWFAERRFITSEDIARIARPGPGTVPLIFSIACSAAAFDESLLRDAFVIPDESSGKQSIGVSLLRSPAGAVAYLGSVRPTAGSPQVKVDAKGNLNSIDSTYSLKIFETILEKYRVAGEGHLGDFILGALSDYSKAVPAKLSKDRSSYSYFNFALLGDPAMRLPKRGARESVFGIASALDEIEASFSAYMPELFTPTEGFALKFKAPSDVQASVYLQSGLMGVTESLLRQTTHPAGDFPLAWRKGDASGRYFVRLENTKGTPVERQVWFRASPQTAKEDLLPAMEGLFP